MYQYIEYGYIWKLSTPAPVCVLFLKEQIPYKLQLVRLCLIDSLVRPRAATALLGGVEVRRLLLVVRLYLPQSHLLEACSLLIVVILRWPNFWEMDLMWGSSVTVDAPLEVLVELLSGERVWPILLSSSKHYC